MKQLYLNKTGGVSDAQCQAGLTSQHPASLHLVRKPQHTAHWQKTTELTTGHM